MTHHSRKTSFSPPARDLRKRDQEPARVPPHKKERKYLLELRLERVTVGKFRKEFTKRADMQAFRARVQTVLDRPITVNPRPLAVWLGDWRLHYDIKMDCASESKTQGPPVFTEIEIS